MVILVGVISPAPIWILPRHFIDQLRAEFPQHTFLEAWDRDTLRKLLPAADVAFTPFVDRDIFPAATRLRWIQSPAVGVGSLMYPDLLTSQVIISSARGIRARAIAEHVVAVSLAMARQLPAAMRYQMSHHWAQNELEGSGSRIRAISDLRMGIVGLGSIGLEIATLALPMGFRVSAIRRRPGSPGTADSSPASSSIGRIDDIWPPERLPDLLAVSDIIVLSLPQTPGSSRLIGGAELDRIKRGAFLINIARGKLIDDDAVVEALRDGRLGGAALDVFSREPLDASSSYWDLPNVIITPHTSGAMRDYWTPLVALFSENLRRFERGAPLLNVVDKAAGY
jgi:phosphoglycerate dehydrogenase-like enzyme